MDQNSLIFNTPSPDQPIIYAKSWFSLGGQAETMNQPSVEALTARLKELHVEKIKCKKATGAVADSTGTPSDDADDDEFDANFGRELSFLLGQLRIRNLDVQNLPFMPYIC